MPLIVVAAVIGIYVMFRPAEPTDIYWVNFIWSVVSFGGCSMYLFSARTDGKGNHSTGVSIAIGIYLVFYTIFLLVVMTAHFALVEPGVIWTLTSFPSPYAKLLRMLAPLFQENPELGRGIYYAVFITTTVIFLVTVTLLMRSDKSHLEREKKLDEETSRTRDYAAQMDFLAIKMANKCLNGNIRFKNLVAGQTPFVRLQREMHALTPNVMRIDSAQRELDNIVQEAEKWINTDGIEDKQADLQSWVNDAVERIKWIKQNAKN